MTTLAACKPQDIVEALLANAQFVHEAPATDRNWQQFRAINHALWRAAEALGIAGEVTDLLRTATGPEVAR